MNRSTLRDVAVFVLLVAIGVLGRWGQPEWSFTPIAAVTIFGGFYFGRRFAALLVPLAVFGISNMALPAYGSCGVMLTIYATMTMSVALGWMLRRPSCGLVKVAQWSAVGLVPATVFYVVSNLAVWYFNGALFGYEPTLAGLTACYAAAIPFFRTMLVGDLFYVSVLFGVHALATQLATRQLKLAEAKVQ